MTVLWSLMLMLTVHLSLSSRHLCNVSLASLNTDYVDYFKSIFVINMLVYLVFTLDVQVLLARANG